jgi:hypothetical protein
MTTVGSLAAPPDVDPDDGALEQEAIPANAHRKRATLTPVPADDIRACFTIT